MALGLLPWFGIATAVLLLLFYIRFRLIGSQYWSKRNIHHLRPNFLIGNFWNVNFTTALFERSRKIHLENREHSAVGCWMFSEPILFIIDRDLVKRILIKDFGHFRDRGVEIDSNVDPLSGHLFFLSGVKWRNLRVKLTPTFTSGKMKMMFPIMVECGQQLQRYLNGIAGTDIEIKDVLARLTTDIISSCAFGIQSNSLENPNSEFRIYGKKIFQTGISGLLKNLLFGLSPELFKLLQIRLVPEDVSDFFINAVRDTIEFREKNNVTRNDFLQLLIQLMRAGKVEDADANPVNVTGYTDEELVQKFELNEAAAQCFVFFGAGFETSSTAMTFALYELAFNPDIQTKLQKEIDDTIQKHEKLTYEAMCEMEYLDLVVQETLRKYPPVGVLQRACNTEYYIPELNLTIEKKRLVLISVNGLHEDPDVYPKPEVFDPERFREEAKSGRHPMSYLPFGDGPRNCIGNRFGLMQVKVGLISVLQQYSVDICRDTPVPVNYDVTAFVLTPRGGVPLHIKKRK